MHQIRKDLGTRNSKIQEEIGLAKWKIRVLLTVIAGARSSVSSSEHTSWLFTPAGSCLSRCFIAFSITGSRRYLRWRNLKKIGLLRPLSTFIKYLTNLFWKQSKSTNKKPSQSSRQEYNFCTPYLYSLLTCSLSLTWPQSHLTPTQVSPKPPILLLFFQKTPFLSIIEFINSLLCMEV